MTDKTAIDRTGLYRKVLKDGLQAHSDDVYAALRKTLAAPQPAQPAEPVAWMRPSENGYDPVFRDHSRIIACTGNPWAGWIPLYASPPPQRHPLTDEQIDSIALDYSLPHSTRSFARAIEAHITGETK